MWYKTRRARLSRALQRIKQFCQRSRHLPVKEQHARLSSRLRGHFNYFGVNGNSRSLLLLLHETEKIWFKWLLRRSQRTRMTWARYGNLLKSLPFPRPRIVVRMWA